MSTQPDDSKDAPLDSAGFPPGQQQQHKQSQHLILCPTAALALATQVKGPLQPAILSLLSNGVMGMVSVSSDIPRLLAVQAEYRRGFSVLQERLRRQPH